LPGNRLRREPTRSLTSVAVRATTPATISRSCLTPGRPPAGGSEVNVRLEPVLMSGPDELRTRSQRWPKPKVGL